VATDGTRDEFIEAAAWHGTLDKAAAMRAQYPDLAKRDIVTAAVLGDDALVRQNLANDRSLATLKIGPYQVEPLVYLCLSKYLRLDKSRSAAFLRAATALLDAGADPNAGFLLKGEFEPALYGAAGVAHHAGMTRLLLERGAIPDGEVVYHAAEEYDLEAMQVLVQSGKLNEEHLTTLLIRKIDWHDYEGVKWLLEHGVKAVTMSRWGTGALGHALLRDNDLPIIDLLLDHGADPMFAADGKSGIAMAAWGGRSDVLESLRRRGVPIGLQGIDELVAACAMGDTARARSLVESEPALLEPLRNQAGRLLAAFSGTGNWQGVRLLLDLGLPVKALFEEGDGYYGIAPKSMPIHVAAWRARHSIVKLLIERGSPADVKDGKGRTPLQLAVKACVDSYWTEYRSPESVKTLLEAGASVLGVLYPSGYGEVDEPLRAAGATASAAQVKKETP